MISSVTLSTAAGAATALVRAASAEPRAAKAGSAAELAAGAARHAEPAVARGIASGLVAASRTRRSPRRSVSSRSSVAGYAGAAPSASKSSTSKSKASSASAAAQAAGNDPLAFLKDPKLSIEEKLMRLLAHLNAQWEKDMQKQLDAFKGSESSGTTKGKTAAGKEASSGGKSLTQTLVGAAKQFFPGVGFALEALKNPAIRAVATKIGGPVLAAAATAMGFPVLAPALLKYAPAVIDAAAGVASILDGGSISGKTSSADKSSGSATSSGAAGSGDSAGGTKMSASEQQLAIMEIQRLREKQKEMFALVSNTLKSGHDMRMGVISNLR